MMMMMMMMIRRVLSKTKEVEHQKPARGAVHRRVFVPLKVPAGRPKNRGTTNVYTYNYFCYDDDDDSNESSTALWWWISFLAGIVSLLVRYSATTIEHAMTGHEHLNQKQQTKGDVCILWVRDSETDVEEEETPQQERNSNKQTHVNGNGNITHQLYILSTLSYRSCVAVKSLRGRGVEHEELYGLLWFVRCCVLGRQCLVVVMERESVGLVAHSLFVLGCLRCLLLCW